MSTVNGDLSIVAIIALYNGAGFIEQAVRSVLGQTRQPDEFIVVDDGSTDDGPAIVARLAEEFPQIRLLGKANGGQSSARNFGVANSTSQLIALLDQDDYWYPDHLEELAKPFQERRSVPLGWTYSNLDEIDEGGRLVRRRFLDHMPIQHPKTSLDNCLSEDMFILPSASLIAREAFEAVGGFDERLSGYEDEDIFVRMFRAGYDNEYLDKPLSAWRIYGTSTTFTPRMARSRMIYVSKLLAEFPDDPSINRYYTRDLIAPRFYRTLMSEYMTCLRLKNVGSLSRVLNDLLFIVPHMHWRRRLKIRAALPIMRRYHLAALSIRFYFLAMKVVR